MSIFLSHLFFLWDPKNKNKFGDIDISRLQVMEGKELYLGYTMFCIGYGIFTRVQSPGVCVS